MLTSLFVCRDATEREEFAVNSVCTQRPADRYTHTHTHTRTHTYILIPTCPQAPDESPSWYHDDVWFSVPVSSSTTVNIHSPAQTHACTQKHTRADGDRPR